MRNRLVNTEYDSQRFQSDPATLNVIHLRDNDDDDDDDDDSDIDASIIVGVTLAVTLSLLSLAIVAVSFVELSYSFNRDG